MDPRTVPGLTAPGSACVRRQDSVRSGHGILSMDQIRPHRAAVWRQRGRAYAVVPRAVPRHGVCSVGVAREAARHRGQSLGQREQAACDGLSFGGQAVHAGRRQRIARLAHLVRPCHRVDTSRTQVLPGRRRAGRRVGQHGLCPGLQHRRPVPEPALLGTVPIDQGGHQAAHVARSARGHSSVHSYQRRQDVRRERAGHARPRDRRALRDGSRLPGLRKAAR